MQTILRIRKYLLVFLPLFIMGIWGCGVKKDLRSISEFESLQQITQKKMTRKYEDLAIKNSFEPLVLPWIQ